MPAARQVLWVSVASALAFIIRAFWFEPVPGAWGLLLLTWLALLCLLGVLIPRWEMFADVLWCAPAGQSGVALTFDDGPDPKTTPKILTALLAEQALATFFVIGKKAAQHPEMIRAMHQAGHTIGMHSWSHERWYAFKTPNSVVRDIERCQRLLFSLTGQHVTLFRPPIGQISPRTAKAATRCKVTLVGWAVRSMDGLRTKPTRALSRLEANLADGAIVLLHDAAERGDYEPASIELLPGLLRRIRERGLRCVALSEWV